MPLFRILLIAFVLIPAAEIYVLIQVGSVIGALPTIALVIFTAVLGATLIRIQGLATVQRVQSELAAGGIPAMGMLEGAVLLVAGALLLTPGFITDALGFACLVPAWRQAAIRRLLALQHSRNRGPPAPPGGRVLDAEFTREDR